MSDNQLNIKSTTIEKALDLAKEFLGKLISPTVEEVGLFLSDNIKYYRFKNQVKILLKAKTYIEENNIKIKEIPIKILVPLLENASLEEDEELQDKWAKLLANMADSESNIQNQVFPYILSQISIDEFNALKILSENEMKALRYNNNKVEAFEQDGFKIELEEYEKANVERLGLIRKLPPKIYVPEFRIESQHSSQWHQIDVEYDINNFGYRITELGEKLLEVCS